MFKIGCKITKKILKIALWFFAVLFLLNLVVVSLFFIPPIQKFSVDKTNTFLSEFLGGDVTVQSLYLSPFLELKVSDISINDHKKNTMIGVGTLSGKLHLSQTTLSNIHLKEVKADNVELLLKR